MCTIHAFHKMFIKQACVTLICLDVIRCSDVIRERGVATIMSMETSNYCHFKWKYCFTLWCTMKSNSYVGALFFLKSCLHVSPHTDCQRKCRLALDVNIFGGVSPVWWLLLYSPGLKPEWCREISNTTKKWNEDATFQISVKNGNTSMKPLQWGFYRVWINSG